MIRRPPRSTRVRSSAASDVYKRQIHQFADDVRARDLEVVRALASGEAVMQLARLGIDEIRGEHLGVAPEQGVGERDVAPVEACLLYTSDAATILRV